MNPDNYKLQKTMEFAEVTKGTFEIMITRLVTMGFDITVEVSFRGYIKSYFYKGNHIADRIGNRYFYLSNFSPD